MAMVHFCPLAVKSRQHHVAPLERDKYGGLSSL
jgi:hypothetical protein